MDTKTNYSDFKPVAFVLYTIILFCFASYAVAETMLVKNFAVFFLLVSVACLSVCFFYCRNLRAKSSSGTTVTTSSNQSTCPDPSIWELDEVARICSAYHGGIQHDIDNIKNDVQQIKELVRNAASELTEHFYSITSSVDHQQRLVEVIVNSNQDTNNDKLSSQIWKFNQQIKNDSNSCIRSLQFEDILSQIADHANLYLTDMEKYLANLGKVLATLEPGGVPNSDITGDEKYSSDLKKLHEELKRQNRTNIRQNNVSEGRIELF